MHLRMWLNALWRSNAPAPHPTSSPTTTISPHRHLAGIWVMKKTSLKNSASSRTCRSTISTSRLRRAMELITTILSFSHSIKAFALSTLRTHPSQAWGELQSRWGEPRSGHTPCRGMLVVRTLQRSYSSQRERTRSQLELAQPWWDWEAKGVESMLEELEGMVAIVEWRRRWNGGSEISNLEWRNLSSVMVA